MTTRQEIYDRIRETSKNEVILEEMIRLGYWPRGKEGPDDPASEIRRRGELDRLLKSLTSESKRLGNVEALKKAMRKQRMEESKRKRKENKERRLREKQERAEAWKLKKQSEIVYLGKNVSAGLNSTEGNDAKLRDLKLPVTQSATAIAAAMEISVSQLRFLAFHRRTSTVTHYKQFAIRKKSGGLRKISAPKPRLKRVQMWVLENILSTVEIHPAAHGFRVGRSIVTNAQPHVGMDVVVNADMKDFFPTVTYPRVRGIFQNMGYSNAAATIFALLCCEPERQEIELDGKNYHVATGHLFLPQGAPTSPAITNLICRGLDARLNHLAKNLGFGYTRYADDITFSGSGEARQNIGKALRRLAHIVADEGFELHPDKTRVFHKGRRQEVTGIVVNEKVSVSRKKLRQFRATLYQIEKDGPQDKSWGNGGDVIESILGFANFVAMVDAERGNAFQEQVRRIIRKYRWNRPDSVQRSRWDEPVIAGPPKPIDQPIAPTDTAFAGGQKIQTTTASTPKKPWWKFW